LTCLLTLKNYNNFIKVDVGKGISRVTGYKILMCFGGKLSGNMGIKGSVEFINVLVHTSRPDLLINLTGPQFPYERHVLN